VIVVAITGACPPRVVSVQLVLGRPPLEDGWPTPAFPADDPVVAVGAGTGVDVDSAPQAVSSSPAARQIRRLALLLI
jgi:hypothetical protein